jgi:hypothetical protein
MLVLQGIYSDVNQLPALGSTLTYNDAANIDGSLQSITYFSINHMFYKYKDQPFKTYGPTNLVRTKKALYQSASIFSFPQTKIGEGIKPKSFTLTGSAITLASDLYGNVYDVAINTSSSFATGENDGMKDLMSILIQARITYESANVTYVQGVPTSNGSQLSIGYAA